MDPVIDSFEITALQWSNVRKFKDFHLDLRDAEGKPRKRTLIIGKNGTCKSTILRAIAIGLADQTDASSLISHPIGSLVSREKAEAKIEITLAPTGQSQPSITGTTVVYRHPELDKEEILPKNWRKGKGDGIMTIPPVPFICGYGAGRFGTGNDTGRSYRIADAVATLFKYDEHLIATELTLHRLQTLFGTKLYDSFLLGIKRVLGLSDADKIELARGGGVIIEGPTIGNRIPLEGWADGYRLTFNWLLDLYAWAMRKGSIDENGHIEGILLIDEIEQHLHPSMQGEILPRLSELLPKMQIFATTHSPLVVLDAKPEELIVLHRAGDEVVVEQRVPDFSGYSAEDMLSDPRLFDTEVYGSETQEKLSEYRKLASTPKEERSPEERSKLRALASEINSFETPQERESETSRLLKELMTKYGL